MAVEFISNQKVLFRHCDPAGIVFFPRYFEMINDCVEQFFAEYLGWPFEELLLKAGMPTAEISTRFIAPSRHGDRLKLVFTTTRIGRSSLGYHIKASCNQDVRFETEATLVHVNEHGKPAAWPEHIKIKLTEGGS